MEQHLIRTILAAMASMGKVEYRIKSVRVFIEVRYYLPNYSRRNYIF